MKLGMISDMSRGNLFCEKDASTLINLLSMRSLLKYLSLVHTSPRQCDQKKIAKCLEKLPKSDFTRKMNDFNTFTKIA